MNTENKQQTAADYWINNCLEIDETDIGRYYMSRENFLMSMEQFAAQQTAKLQQEILLYEGHLDILAVYILNNV